MYHICIPSHNRPDKVETPNVLGINEYYIFVNDEQQAEKYRKHHTNVIVTNTIGITKARNAILDYFPIGSNILMCDDDIKGLYRLVGKKSILMQQNEVKKLILKMFDLCKQHNIGLWGVGATFNPYFMRHKFSYRTFIIGTFCGCITSDIRMDENLKVKEDYDFTIQHILRDRCILRQDGVGVRAGHYTQGGCDSLRAINEDKKAKEYLMSKYPKFVRSNPRSDNEVLLRFPQK